MSFVRYTPSEWLRPFVKEFIITEQDEVSEYKVLPTTGLVMGFQYKGQLHVHENDEGKKLEKSGVTGFSDRLKMFKNDRQTGSVLVYFTEWGFSFFCDIPANELFNASASSSDVFDKQIIRETEEKLFFASNDAHRILIIEEMLKNLRKEKQRDRLVEESIRILYDSKGLVRIKDLEKQLCISQSPFEKRFRKWIGASPKKFASLVRFHHVLNNLQNGQSFTDLCFEYDFYDLAHFNKVFRQYTGDSPEQFRKESINQNKK